jgi:hypothetical protein
MVPHLVVKSNHTSADLKAALTAYLNVLILTLSISLAVFLTLCLSVCLITWRQAKVQSSQTHHVVPLRRLHISLSLTLEEYYPAVKDPLTAQNQYPPAYSPGKVAPQGLQAIIFNVEAPSDFLYTLSPSPAFKVSPSLPDDYPLW